MRPWPPDPSTMQGSRVWRDPSVFGRLTWGNASRSIPRISRDQRQIAAADCIWLRSVTSLRRRLERISPGQNLFPRVKRRAWDSNPR